MSVHQAKWTDQSAVGSAQTPQATRSVAVVLNIALLAALLALVLPRTVPAQEGDFAPQTPRLQILVDAADPYAPLADEIAAEEVAHLVHRIGDLDLAAAFVVWVASPDRLSESALLALSALIDTSPSPPAVGIITGSTLGHARALWERDRELVRNPPGADPASPPIIVAAGAFDRSERIRQDHAISGYKPGQPGVIRTFLPGGGAWYPRVDEPITREALLRALGSADYLYWSRHVGKRSWAWYDEEIALDDVELRSDDLGDLPPVIIHTPSCQSFTPWVDGSIALAFVDSGAAAYIGHLYPPLSSGTFIGHMTSPPGLHSWPGVPMGVIAQVQARATVRAAASGRLLFMLGDPRLSVLSEAPYTITNDDQGWPVRTITGRWTHPGPEGTGVLPLRIENAARPSGSSRFSFVRVRNVGAAAERDRFYNGRIQTLDAGFDKIVLVQHPGAGFEIELRRDPPLVWRLLDPIRDSLEFAWVYIRPLSDPPGLAAAPTVLLATALTIRGLTRRHRGGRGRLRVPAGPALLGGAVIGLVQTAFLVLSAGQAAAFSYQVRTHPLELVVGFLSVASLAALGLLWAATAGRWIGRALGVLLAAGQELLLTAVYAGGITVINFFQANSSEVGFRPLTYAPARQAAIALVVQLWLVLLVLRRTKVTVEVAKVGH